MGKVDFREDEKKKKKTKTKNKNKKTKKENEVGKLFGGYLVGRGRREKNGEAWVLSLQAH